MTVNSVTPRTIATVLYTGEGWFAGVVAGGAVDETLPVIDAVAGPDEVKGVSVEFEGRVAFWPCKRSDSWYCDAALAIHAGGPYPPAAHGGAPGSEPWNVDEVVAVVTADCERLVEATELDSEVAVGVLDCAKA